MNKIDYKSKAALNALGVHLDGKDGHHAYLPMTDEIINMAMDAQPELGTTPNAGVLSMFTTYYDPKVIEFLFSPMKAAEVAGKEVRKGSWTDASGVFNVLEFTGSVSSYGDYSNNGVSKANPNYPQRQPYLYQTTSQWGALELEKMALMRLNWSSQLTQSSIFTLNKFANESYFFGVEGLQNYGLLNDPNLLPPTTPIPVGGNTTWDLKNGFEIYNDWVKLVTLLITQSQGIVSSTTKMTFAVSPYAFSQLNRTTEFMNKSAKDMIMENYPNVTIVDAPELATAGGQLIRLKADAGDGTLTEEVVYNEKLKSFPLFVQHSNYSQKYAQGTFGAWIYRPVLISTMLGV